MPADVIFVNGDIFAGARQISTPPYVQVLPRVQALAVAGGRILAAGSNEDVGALGGANTQAVDLRGKFVMPGFNDAHLHLVSGGFEALNVSLTGARSLAEMRSRIAARAAIMPSGGWIRGRGWDETRWQEKRLPVRQDLDEVCGRHPAMFHRADSHVAVVNTAALRAAGIDAHTPDPGAGKIDRDEHGEPTGVLRETAMDLVAGRIPPPNSAERRCAIELALRQAARCGVTSLQDNSDWENFQVFEALAAEGKLTARVREWLDFNSPVDVLSERRGRVMRSDRLATGMLKGFMDGSLGSRTAALLAPYADDPGNRGLPRYEQAVLNKMVQERARAGFQIGLHAIGDGGAELALQAFAGAPNGRELRFRIEHAQVTSPEQVRRFAELNVIASMQPSHLLTDMTWAEQRLGSERARHSYAWAEFLRAGVRLAFGTDFPIEPVTPFRGIYAAVTRESLEADGAYYREQAITVEAAIAAYTTGAAYAEFAENEKGTLEPGMVADFVVLDSDLTKAPPNRIPATRVLRTVVGGVTVFEASPEQTAESR
jgi:predicted amidohydrolase YtcJ